jgi:LysM repeat protein
MEMKRLILALAVMTLLVLSACNRSAQPSNPSAATDSDLPFPTSEFPQMDILQTAAVATQTAQAAGGGQTTPGTTPGAPQGTPGGEQPTAAPTQAQPTSPPQPTSTPAPTEPPEPIDCPNPYTVQEGDWVYKIGRTCGVDPNVIIQLNGLVYPFLLYPGQQLTLP